MNAQRSAILATVNATQREQIAALAPRVLALHVPDPGGLGRNPRARVGNGAGNRGRGPKFWLWGALAAVVLVALVVLTLTQVFHAFGQHLGTTADKTPITATQTPTLPPCQASQLWLTFIGDSLAGGHMRYGFSAVNTSAQACVLNGYPDIHLSDNHSDPLAITVRRTTSAPTFTTPPPQPITALPAPSTPATDTQDGGVFYLDWSTTASPGTTCASVGGISLTPSASAGYGVMFTPCGQVAVSPFLAVPLAAPGPTSAAGLPTCLTNQLLLTFIKGGAAMGRASRLYSFTNVGASPCALDGYPTLQLRDARGRPITIHINKTTSAFTFQAQPPQALSLGVGQSTYFSVDFGDAPLPGVSCVTAATSMAITPPGNITSLSISTAPNPCGQINIAPVQATPMG